MLLVHALHALAHEERYVFLVACAIFFSGQTCLFVMLIEALSHRLSSNVVCVGDEAGQFITDEPFFSSLLPKSTG
jgi:hypothetical protein